MGSRSAKRQPEVGRRPDAAVDLVKGVALFVRLAGFRFFGNTRLADGKGVHTGCFDAGAATLATGLAGGRRLRHLWRLWVAPASMARMAGRSQSERDCGGHFTSHRLPQRHVHGTHGGARAIVRSAGESHRPASGSDHWAGWLCAHRACDAAVGSPSMCHF